MEFKEERDYEFLKVCENIRKSSKEYISTKNIAIRAIQSNAPSFFLSERELWKIIREKEKINQIPKSEIKAELHRTIRRRYRQLKLAFPNMKIGKIIQSLALASAPRFYITEARAVTLYYQLLKQKK